jgi:hypothetical protein
MPDANGDWPGALARGFLGLFSGDMASRVAGAISSTVQNSGIVTGVIHDVFGHTGAYIVSTPGGRRQLAACMSDVGITPSGARDVGQLNIHDQVLCYFPPNTDYGYILGAAPQQIFDARFVLPDSLVMRSLAGFVQDQMHYTPYQREDNDLGNFSCGRPADALQGDWGKINELGVAFWLGKFMAQMRASDAAKIEAFWGDDLLRIVGYNFQRYLSGAEMSAVDDQGEFDEVEFYTPFMWEALGSYVSGSAVFDENEGEDGALKQDNENSRFEPKEAKQVIVPRGVDMRGYVGDLRHRRVVMLPVDAAGIAKADDEKDFRGLGSDHAGLDGGIHLRSAKEVILEKSLMMPVPRRLLDPDAPDGDTDQNYKAANVYGDGPTQEKKPFRWGDTSKPINRVTELWEYHAYLFGKYGLQVLDAHANDWETPEEADLEIASGTPNEIDPDLFKKLGFDFSTPLPKYGEIIIDQRDGHTVRYYRSRSGVYLLDDGSTIIEDGYGSQIIMSGGSIRMACQGDIINQPGRSFITWAPRDFIARAGWCAELSAAKRDVRIKAEQSLHLLANATEKSSILIECRSEEPVAKSEWEGEVGEDIEANGIIIKGEKSAIALWTKQLFGGIAENEEGSVEFNAGSGQATLAGTRVGLEALSELSAMVGALRGATPEPPQLIITTGRAMLRSKLDVVGDIAIWPGSQGSGGLSVGGSAAVKDNVQVEGSVRANRHFASDAGGDVTSQSEQFIFTPDPAGEGARQDEEADTVQERIFQDGFDRPVFEDDENGVGNQEVWDAVGFSFRKSVEHYKADSTFQIYEARWQQLYRANGVTEKWDEPIVEAPSGEETMPHPGKAAWKDSPRYNYAPPGSGVNVDYAKGNAKPRADQSETSPGTSQAVLDSEYLINVQSD